MSHWAAQFFTGKSVLVSGGTSGIGLGLALELAAAGARVHATGGTEAEVVVVRRAHPGIGFSALDVRDKAGVAGLAAPIRKLDILVNCAGINRRADEFDPDVFEEVVDVNLFGTNRLCAALHDALRDGGVILNIASMFAFAGAGHAPAYAASKGAVGQLTKSLAIAFAKDGIRVNALAPGWIETAMTVPARADAARNAAIMARTPMGRWGEPRDLAGAALFLCSPLAGFITGVILPVDGGYLAV